MTQPVANHFFTSLPPLTGGQETIFALGAGFFGYQILAELVHNFAQEHFENWNIRPTYATAVLTLFWIGFIASSSSTLLVYFCFVGTGLMAFAIYRSPLSLESPPPSGLLDMVAEAQSHPEWKYCLPNEALIPLLETALKHPDKQSVMLLGDSKIGKTLQIEHLAWMLKHKKIPQGSPLEKSRIFRWDNNKSATIQELIRFFKNHPNAFFFIDMQPGEILTFYSARSAMGRGELRLIGTATSNVFKKDFASSDILDGLWHQLPINEPTREECVKILQIKIPLLVKEYGNLSITEEALNAVILLSKLIWPQLKQPASAFDLLNRICSHLVGNPLAASSESPIKINAKAIIQGAIKAQLIDKDFELSLLQKGSSPPSGLLDMELEAQAHPEWEYCLPNETLIPKIVMAQAESWKKSILLVGQTTNTTLLIQNLCWKIKNKKIPQIKNLENLRIVKLNPTQLMDDGNHNSEKKKDIVEIIEYLANRPNTICIIENASFLVKGPSFYSDKDRGFIVAIKEALSDGKLRLIGTTSTLNYKESSSLTDRDDILQAEKLWTVHQVPELTLVQCTELLMQAKEDIAHRYSGIKIDDEAIKTAAILAEAYKVNNQGLWEVAYDLISQGCAQELISQKTGPSLTKEDLIRVVLEQKMSNDSYEKIKEFVDKKLSN
jgi:ATP-dependent Clp protease ATP-binding subunit ClpA